MFSIIEKNDAYAMGITTEGEISIVITDEDLKIHPNLFGLFDGWYLSPYGSLHHDHYPYIRGYKFSKTVQYRGAPLYSHLARIRRELNKMDNEAYDLLDTYLARKTG